MYYNKDNRKRHAEATARRHCKQQLDPQQQPPYPQPIQRPAVFPTTLKSFSKDYSAQDVPGAGCCCECADANLRKKLKKITKQKKCNAVFVMANGSDGCLPQGNTFLVSTYDRAAVQLADAQDLSKSSSDIYYEALTMPIMPTCAAAEGSQQSVPPKQISYTVAALKQMNAEWSSDAAVRTVLQLRGTHTGETTTDPRADQKRALHLHATGSNCCRLAKCLNEFNIVSMRRRDQGMSRAKSSSSLIIENWRAKPDNQSDGNEDAFRAFNGYKLHGIFRRTARWSASNITGKVPQRAPWQEQSNGFKLSYGSTSCITRASNTDTLLKTARLNSQALLRSLNLFNFETAQADAVQKSETFMAELQHISQLLKRLQRDIDDLQGNRGAQQQRLTTSSEPYLHRHISQSGTETNLVSIYATSKNCFRTESSSDSDDKLSMADITHNKPAAAAAAGKPAVREQQKSVEPIYEELKRAASPLHAAKSNGVPAIQLCELRPATQLHTIERCTPPTSFMGTDSSEDLHQPKRTSYTTYTIVTPSYLCARPAPVAADTHAHAHTSETNPPTMPTHLHNFWRHVYQILKQFAAACFNLAHQRGGFAFFLMVLLFLFLVLVMFINSSKA